MDKVYVKLLSVSLLLSLYGAGFAEPHSQLRSMLREVLLATDSEVRLQCGALPVRSASLGGDCCAVRGGCQMSSFLRLRSFVASFTDRLASLCRRGVVEGDTVVDGESGGLSAFHSAVVGEVATGCIAPPVPYDVVCKSQCEVCASRWTLFFDVAPCRAGPLSISLS